MNHYFINLLILSAFLFSNCQTLQNNSKKINCSKKNFQYNENIIKLINRFRTKNNRQKLYIDSELIALAGKRAWSISNTGNLSHIDSNGRTALQRLKESGIVRNFIGENLILVLGEADFLKNVLKNWKTEKKERKILLSKSYIRTGSGFSMIGNRCIVVSLFTD